MKKPVRALVPLVALALFYAGGASAGVPTLGANGEVYSVLSGPYGNLFPSGNAAPAGNLVLALVIDRLGQPAERLLVPTTEDEFPEDSPAVILDAASQNPFIVWQHRQSYIFSQLNLVQLTADGWSEVATISANPFRKKASPSFVVTHDYEVHVDGDGPAVRHDRTVAHIVWREEVTEGEPEAFYAPVVIDDGAYVGWNPIYRLNDLVGDLGPAEGPGIGVDLAPALAIGPGENNQSVVIAFAASALGRMVTVQAQVLPRALSELGDAMRFKLETLGAALNPADAGCHQALADLARHQLIDFGNRLQVGFLNSVADELGSFLLRDDTPCDAGAVSDEARLRLLDYGARFVSSGIAPIRDFARHQLIDFGNRMVIVPLPHQVRLGLVSAPAAPATGAGTTNLFVSRKGTNMLIAWEHAGLLSYRETRGEGWSSEFVLQPQSADGWTAAYQVLRDRIGDR